MQFRKALAALVLVGVAAIGSAATAATLIGDTINLDRTISDIDFKFCRDFVGVDPCTTVVTGDDSDKVALSNGNNLFVDPGASGIHIQFGPSNGSGLSVSEHLLIFSDLDFGGGIANATYVTDLAGFTADRFSFTGSSVTVNFAGLNFPGGQYMDISLEAISAVPLPASLPFLVFGLGALGTLRRR